MARQWYIFLFISFKKTCRIFSFILTICISDKKRRKSNVYRYHTMNETMNETKWNKQIIMFFMKHHIYETEKALCLSILRYLITYKLQELSFYMQLKWNYSSSYLSNCCRDHTCSQRLITWIDRCPFAICYNSVWIISRFAIMFLIKTKYISEWSILTSVLNPELFSRICKHTREISFYSFIVKNEQSAMLDQMKVGLRTKKLIFVSLR